MKVGGEFSGFNISANGMSVQRRKMNIIAENIANADNIRTEDGKPYQRKYMTVSQKKNSFSNNIDLQKMNIPMAVTRDDHIAFPNSSPGIRNPDEAKISFEEEVDKKAGDIIYMPDHPDADENGYVQMSNVNIITEMVEMIAATRSYEANLTALNSAKQIAKDSLEI